jgi:hypothetical protein
MLGRKFAYVFSKQDVSLYFAKNLRYEGHQADQFRGYDEHQAPQASVSQVFFWLRLSTALQELR